MGRKSTKKKFNQQAKGVLLQLVKEDDPKAQKEVLANIMEERIPQSKAKALQDSFASYIVQLKDAYLNSVASYFAVTVLMERASQDVDQFKFEDFKTLDKFLEHHTIINDSVRMQLDASKQEGTQKYPSFIPLADPNSDKQSNLTHSWKIHIIEFIERFVESQVTIYCTNITEINRKPLISKYLSKAELKEVKYQQAFLERVVTLIGFKYFSDLRYDLYNLIAQTDPILFFNRGKEDAMHYINDKTLQMAKEQGEDFISEEEAIDIRQSLQRSLVIYRDLWTQFQAQASKKVLAKHKHGKMSNEYYKKHFQPFLQNLKGEISELTIRELSHLFMQFDSQTIKDLATFKYE